jgi:NADH-quinone oxidoreductase E subunit
MEQMESTSTESAEELEQFKINLLKKEDKKGSLIPLLQSAQETYGFIPESSIYYISEIIGIPAAEIYGVITFYAQFRLRPLGENIIKICQGTACHVNGAKNILNAIKNELDISVGETSEDGKFSLQSVACIGCCSLAPVMMINDETYGRLTPKKIAKILKEYK